MSDGEGFGYGIGGSSNASTDDFVLDFGLDTTDGAFGDRVPEGTHKFLVHELYEISFTNNGEAQIVVPLKVVESGVSGAVGVTHQERLLIPSTERRENDPDKWKIMMKGLRLRLEGMTGQQFRDNNLSINPAVIFPVGLMFVATVYHEKTKSSDGREFTNVRFSNYVPVSASQAQSFGGFAGTGATQPAEEPF